MQVALESMHNGCHSTRGLRKHGLAYSASRKADGLCKQTRRAPIHASSQCVVPAAYCPGAQSSEKGVVPSVGVMSRIAAMVYFVVM